MLLLVASERSTLICAEQGKSCLGLSLRVTAATACRPSQTSTVFCTLVVCSPTTSCSIMPFSPSSLHSVSLVQDGDVVLVVLGLVGHGGEVLEDHDAQKVLQVPDNGTVVASWTLPSFVVSRMVAQVVQPPGKFGTGVSPSACTRKRCRSSSSPHPPDGGDLTARSCRRRTCTLQARRRYPAIKPGWNPGRVVSSWVKVHGNHG